MDRARHSLCPVGLLDSPLFPSKIVNLFPLPPKHIYSFPAFLIAFGYAGHGFTNFFPSSLLLTPAFTNSFPAQKIGGNR